MVGKDAARLGNEIGLKVAGLPLSRATGRSRRPGSHGQGGEVHGKDGQFEAGARLIDTIARNVKDGSYRRDPASGLRDDRGEELQGALSESMLST